MCHTAGEATDRFHLLRLSKPLLQLGPLSGLCVTLGNVPGRCDDVSDRTI